MTWIFKVSQYHSHLKGLKYWTENILSFYLKSFFLWLFRLNTIPTLRVFVYCHPNSENDYFIIWIYRSYTYAMERVTDLVSICFFPTCDLHVIIWARAITKMQWVFFLLLSHQPPFPSFFFTKFSTHFLLLQNPQIELGFLQIYKETQFGFLFIYERIYFNFRTPPKFQKTNLNCSLKL